MNKLLYLICIFIISLTRIIRRTINIPTCTFDRDSIEKLIYIFENAHSEYIKNFPREEIPKQYEKDWEKALFKKSLTLFFTNSRIEGESLEELKSEEWEDELLSIEAGFGGVFGENKMKLSLDFKYPENKRTNSIYLSGHNEIMINGIERKINDFVKTRKNYNYLIYGRYRYFVKPFLGLSIMSICGYLYNIFAQFFGWTTYTFNIKFSSEIITIIIIVYIFSFIIGDIFQSQVLGKIFPEIEYYNPNNFREKIKKIFVFIFTAISALVTLISFIKILSSAP